MKHIIFFCSFLLCGLFGRAQTDVFVVDSLKQEYKLDPNVYFYTDTSNNITIEQFLSVVQQNKTSPYQTQLAVEAPFTYWYIISIANRLSHNNEFVLIPYDLSNLDFYILNNQNQLLQHHVGGSGIPFDQRVSNTQANILPLSIHYNDTVRVVVKATENAQFANFDTIKLKPQQHYYDTYIRKVSFSLFFEGAVIIMFLYNLLFFFMVRDRAYLYYALYILSIVIVSLEGISEFSIVRQMPYISDRMMFTSLFTTLLYVQFIRYFLNISQIRPTFNRYLTYWMYFRLFFAIINLFLYSYPEKMFAANIVNFVFFIELILGIVLIGVAWKNNPRLAGYVVLGYLALAIPLSFVILQQLFFPFNNLEKGWVVQTGVLIELILFSLGLGYRSRSAEREKLQVAEENRRIVEQQNLILEQKVQERTHELNVQKNIVEKKNQDITSSITYASRIQRAILPKQDVLLACFPDSFILFRPRDIVSGDFYFVRQIKNVLLLAAADCTGHGVPGAFMSMLGSALLNEITRKDEPLNAADILDQLRNLIKTALRQTGQTGEQQDGMDIALCVVNNETLQLQFAGAFNPLWIVRAHNMQNIEEIKADRMPIGVFPKERPFTNHELQLQQGDQLYLFSDGYESQFGGEKGEKLKARRMQEYIVSVTHLPMNQQQQALNQKLDQWRGEKWEQVDDVLLIGAKIVK